MWIQHQVCFCDIHSFHILPLLFQQTTCLNFSMLGFSLSCGSDLPVFTAKSVSTTHLSNGCTVQGNWICTSAGGCCKQNHCCHASSNLLSVLTSIILPIGYRFKADLVVINAHDGRLGLERASYILCFVLLLLVRSQDGLHCLLTRESECSVLIWPILFIAKIKMFLQY